MSRTTTGTLDGLAPLWQPPLTPPRWVIWRSADGTMVFDRELNCPAPVDDTDLREVLRRMRDAGAPEYADYPGRACG